jgi:hypothetical protein
MLFRVKKHVYCEIHNKGTNTLCVQNAEVLNFAAVGTHSDHRNYFLKGPAAEVTDAPQSRVFLW